MNPTGVLHIAKAVFFDFDGVLTIDKTGSQSVCNYVCKVTGVSKDIFANEYKKYNYDLLCGKFKHEDIWKELCDNIRTDIPIKILQDSFINTPIDTNVLNLAKSIKARGQNIGIITDNKTDRIDSIVEHNKWQRLFDVIAVSAKIGKGKEQKEIFLYALKKLNLSGGECVFIDNKEENLVIPKALGINVIYFDDKERNIEKLSEGLRYFGINI